MAIENHLSGEGRMAADLDGDVAPLLAIIFSDLSCSR